MEASIAKKVQELKDAIEANDSNEIVEQIETILSENIEILAKTPYFYQLPFSSILSIIQKTDFAILESNVYVIQTIIKGVIKSYKSEAIQLLNVIHCRDCSFTTDDCISIIKAFTTSELCKKLGILACNDDASVEFDYNFELNQKEKKIQVLERKLLKKTNPNLIIFPPVTEKPLDFEKSLHKAAKFGKLTSVQYLLEKNIVDKEQRNKEGNSPLHIAALEGHLPIVKYLIEVQKCDKEARNQTRETPLHYACWNGHLPIVKYLIEEQNVYNEPKNNFGQTPLHFACAKDHVETVKYLIEKQGLNKEATTREGRTPLHHACQRGCFLVVQYLVRRQLVDINATTPNGETPLHVAAKWGQTKIVEFLVSSGANLNARDAQGRKPYYYATDRRTRWILTNKKKIGTLLFIMSLLILFIYRLFF